MEFQSFRISGTHATVYFIPGSDFYLLDFPYVRCKFLVVGLMYYRQSHYKNDSYYQQVTLLAHMCEPYGLTS